VGVSPPEPEPGLVTGAEAAPTILQRPSTVTVPALPDFTRWGSVDRVPLRSVRRSTAKHMTLAWSQIPHVNHQDWADVTELELLRQRHKEAVEARGGKLTLTAFVLKAVVAALKTYPQFNTTLDTDREEIIYKRYYHLGVAADTERGLVVPVVRDVDRKSVTELALEMTALIGRAREGTLSLEELQGGTFTLTNIGALGGTGFAPIVNYPEVAILGLGKAQLQPTVRGTLEEHEVIVRLRMPLVLAFDHRVVDGAEAARFVNVVIEALESPEKLLLLI
jgi:pyruvate dehydrogenase E2 component (dihydrolipoamide acetyltransferase)